MAFGGAVAAADRRYRALAAAVPRGIGAGLQQEAG
jgi:hypothetical protein